MCSIGKSLKQSHVHSIILLIVAVILLMLANIFAQDSQNKYWLDPDELAAYEQEYLEMIKPKPIDPSLGPINDTGFVIIYGQLLEPPYQLSIVGDSLFLNGIRVLPRIISPWNMITAPFEETEQGRLERVITNRVGAKFDQFTSEKREDIHKDILEYIELEEPLVSHAEWSPMTESSSMLYFELKDGEPFGICLPPIELQSDEEMAEKFRQSLPGRKKGLSSHLSVGGLIIMGSGGTLYGLSKDAPETFEKIKGLILTKSYDELENVINDEECVKQIEYYEENK